MSTLGARLARLEQAPALAGSSVCRCPFDFDRALVALGGTPADGQRCRQCGEPSAALAIESVDYSLAGWR